MGQYTFSYSISIGARLNTNVVNKSAALWHKEIVSAMEDSGKLGNTESVSPPTTWMRKDRSAATHGSPSTATGYLRMYPDGTCPSTLVSSTSPRTLNSIFLFVSPRP